MAGEELEVLEANEAFYRAFASRDIEAMAGLWSEHHPVACIHPGWDVLDGREEVLASFNAILSPSAAPRVTCSASQARLLGEVAFVTCQELVNGSRLAATNVFVKDVGRWRMVHHQASPIVVGEEREVERGPAN